MKDSTLYIAIVALVAVGAYLTFSGPVKDINGEEVFTAKNLVGAIIIATGLFLLLKKLATSY